MTKLTIGPMILASSILAFPVLAATQSNDASNNNSPAAASSAPSSNTGTGMTTSRTDTTTTRTDAAAPANSTTADHSTAPRYVTADGQLRAGKIVGASVYNEQDQSVGSVDDVLMSKDNKANTAVISVGGFLGMGSKLVSVPFDQLKIGGDKIVMPGATKASLNSMPEYKYNNA